MNGLNIAKKIEKENFRSAKRVKKKKGNGKNERRRKKKEKKRK